MYKVNDVQVTSTGQVESIDCPGMKITVSELIDSIKAQVKKVQEEQVDPVDGNVCPDGYTCKNIKDPDFTEATEHTIRWKKNYEADMGQGQICHFPVEGTYVLSATITDGKCYGEVNEIPDGS